MIVNSAATLKPKAGNEDFAQFINGHYYYVDKTQYLKEIFSVYNDRLLILRPRRFGKKTNDEHSQAFSRNQQG